MTLTEALHVPCKRGMVDDGNQGPCSALIAGAFFVSMSISCWKTVEDWNGKRKAPS